MSTPDLISSLSCGLQRLRATVPKIIASPPSQPRRAAVALIIRVVPAPDTPIPPQDAPVPTLSEFFSLEWVNAPGARAEVLFLKRAAAPSSNEASTSTAGGEAHVSFPGGRMDEEDENALYTAMRQTWEELGIDLAERDYVCVGQLDDREITTSLGKRLLMVLSPFVFLHLTPYPTSVDPLPDINLHWVSIDHLAHAKPSWGSVTADISVRMAPRYPALRRIIRLLLGSMQFAAIVLNEPSIKGKEREIAPGSDILKVWGLTLGMTLDLLALLHPPQRPKLPLEPDADGLYGLEMAPSMASVFPRFSYPDVNFWIWVFGRRYRNLIRDWEASIRYDVTGERRINWIGQAVNAFYGAVRRALLVVIVLRAIGLLLTLAIGGWWVFSSGM